MLNASTMFIDTHSHIYAEEFDDDRDEVIERAIQAGISKIVLPAIDNESHDRQEALASSHPHLFAQMMGLHPTSVGENPSLELDEARRRLFTNPDKYVAIGEIGLDFYWDTTFKSQQIYALGIQFDWAAELQKPVALHLRNSKDNSVEHNAYTTLFNIINQRGGNPCRGVLHCFSGTLHDALHAINLGFLLGIGGVVTYKKNTLADIVDAVPLSSLVLETDAPYLAPSPHRGKRNESAFVALVAQKIAEIKGIPLSQVARITSDNATRLFNL